MASLVTLAGQQQQSAVELEGEISMLEEQGRRQSIASKESSDSTADTSSQSVCGSLGTGNSHVRRPSSATSYSFGSVSGGSKLRNASISSIGVLVAGSSVGSGGGFGNSSGGGGAVGAGANSILKGHQQHTCHGIGMGMGGSQGSGGIPLLSLSKGVGIAEEDQNSILTTDPHLHRAQPEQQSDGRLPSETSSSSRKLIHPGMEVFNYDTGRPPISERHLTPPLQSPHYTGPKIVSSFNPTHAFFVTRTGTPGLNPIGDSKHHKPHLLQSRGWEIRDVSGVIRGPLDVNANPQRAGTGGIGGKNAAAEVAIENVTDLVFGTWGRWADSGGSHTPWRRSLDSSMYSSAPSNTSFFSYFRTPVSGSLAPRTPSLGPSSVNFRPSIDSRCLPGPPPHIPPDPAYVSLKTNPASSKSTFYSIETAPPISGDFKFPKARGSHSEAYSSETGRIPISQWKVPYNINSPSTITLLNYYDLHNNQQHGYKARPQKSKKVEVWAEESNLRTQFFEMDRSTYTWEYRVRPKMKVPLTTDSSPASSFFPNSGVQTPRIPFPQSPLTPTTPASIPSTPTGMSGFFGTGSIFGHGVQRVVKYRSECLVLIKEVDGAKYIVAEYYFPKSIKSTTVSPVSISSRLRRFMSSPSNTGPATPIPESNLNEPPPTPSTLDSPSFKEKSKEKEKVQHTNLGKHEPGILLLDARGVNKVVAFNSLLIALKREKQRRFVTLNSSSNGARTRRWGYGVHDNDLADDVEKKKEEGKGKAQAGDGVDNVASGISPGSRSRYGQNDITISISPDEDAIEEEEASKNGDVIEPEMDDYSLQGDDWEYDETDGWKRRGPGMVGSRASVS